ncbi:hypothetical protein QN386_24985 [Pseudomonas sp. CCI3.2]|uniref:hypothetical protein n=1 Tax=unclassified Pseudomonas TaxID=196821 RepID=UPI002AC8D082|nr:MULTISPECIES: hypothetical protein [unclassified Pseudomonas]MEA9979317.1 hypothetical protein [Pseudomonas sp. RTS4]MEB0076832.1 hypothetical protein [Pseudomonas sp. MH10out]MEB0104563.1 hypothetical protein [Pseudomonas sp. CCI3.2]MEB0156670.1 hypothetical protein [Pseudomonas sp. AH2 (2023)]MEB0165782.1 hypothetical protein [Pseudomonas sp. CCC4.4]
MKIQNGASAPAGSACPKKATELFYLTHPKAPKALMGPFLNAADAECGRIVMRSADALVTSSLVDSIDEMTHWHGVNNGAICRAFAGTSGGQHE